MAKESTKILYPCGCIVFNSVNRVIVDPKTLQGSIKEMEDVDCGSKNCIRRKQQGEADWENPEKGY